MFQDAYHHCYYTCCLFWLKAFFSSLNVVHIVTCVMQVVWRGSHDVMLCVSGWCQTSCGLHKQGWCCRWHWSSGIGELKLSLVWIIQSNIDYPDPNYPNISINQTLFIVYSTWLIVFWAWKTFATLQIAFSQCKFS